MVTGVLLSYLTGEAVAEAPAEAKSTFMGFFQAVYSVGITGLPMLVGKVAGDVSMQAGYYVLAIGALICAAAAYIYYRRNGRFE